MWKKIFVLVALLSIVVLSGCRISTSQPKEIKEGMYCCSSFDESEGKTKIFWSEYKNCGIPEGISCGGSCPHVVDNKFCN